MLPTGFTVLVSGGAAGVGRGLALAFVEAGANVIVAARDEARGAEVEAAAAGHARFMQCDVGRADDVTDVIAQTVERFGRLDAVVHNATSGRSSVPLAVEDASEEDWEDHLAVALRGAHLLAVSSFDHLRAAVGSFVVLTSTTGIEGNAQLPLYATVKAGQRGFVKALAREWGPFGITVNAVTPLAETPAMAEARRHDSGLGTANLTRTALGRIGGPQRDIGPAVVFLVSPGARYITGQNIFVNGGAHMSG